MDQPPHSKPRPARLVDAEPARPSIAGAAAEGVADPGTTPSARSPDAAPVLAPAPADLSEAVVESGGVVWKVRVLGRSGRAGGRAPPLLLLGFWESDEPGIPHAREVVVAGRALGELGADRLEAALAEALPPPPPGRKRSFFEGMGQGRRGGPPPQEG